MIGSSGHHASQVVRTVARSARQLRILALLLVGIGWLSLLPSSHSFGMHVPIHRDRKSPLIFTFNMPNRSISLRMDEISSSSKFQHIRLTTTSRTPLLSVLSAPLLLACRSLHHHQPFRPYANTSPLTDARRYFKQSEIVLYRQAPEAVAAQQAAADSQPGQITGAHKPQ